MILRQLAVLFTGSLLFSLTLLGADTSGIWTGLAPARNGSPQDIAFKFVQSGSALTGKLYGDFSSTPITNGKIVGDQITFTIIMPEQSGNITNQTTLHFSGTLKGDEMELTRERVPQVGVTPSTDPKRNQLIHSFSLKSCCRRDLPLKPAPDFSYLTDIYFRAGAIKLLPELLQHYTARRPLVVTDPELVRLGVTNRLPLSQFTLYDGVETNPTEKSALAGLQRFREADCDSLVAVGGGSSIDLAKSISLLANHPLPLEQYAFRNNGMAKITAAMPPFFAIPTTAGSGSEVGRAALMTLASGDKVGILSPALLPKAAICDPELTLSMPRTLTAATGMDAISHCIETYCSPRPNPIADSIALDGLRRGFQHLPLAVQNGADLQARSEMMMCALQGGLTFQKGLGAVHSLSHPLGGLAHRVLHHGTLNAIFLPKVLRYNYEACAAKLDSLAQSIGMPDGRALPDVFEQFSSALQLPTRLRDLGVTADDLTAMDEKAMRDHCTQTNPRALTADTCRMLYEESW